MLPQSLTDLAGVVGTADALELSRRLGGTEWFVGGKVDSIRAIADVVGVNQAERIVSLMAGTRLDIPSNAAHHRARRNAEIIALVRQGKPTRDIAVAVGLSQRTIRYIIHQANGAISGR